MRAITRPISAAVTALAVLSVLLLSGCSGGIPVSNVGSGSTACAYPKDGSTPTLVTDLPSFIPTTSILKATCATHTAAAAGKPESYFVTWCAVAERGANITGNLSAFDSTVGTLVSASTAEKDSMIPPCPNGPGGSASIQVTLK
jgi:hypothetical protein